MNVPGHADVDIPHILRGLILFVFGRLVLFVNVVRGQPMALHWQRISRLESAPPIVVVDRPVFPLPSLM